MERILVSNALKHCVIPAQAGIYSMHNILDSRLRGNDGGWYLPCH